VKLKAEKWNC